MEQILFAKYDEKYSIIGIDDWPPSRPTWTYNWQFVFSTSTDIADDPYDGYFNSGISRSSTNKWKPLEKMEPQIMRYAIRKIFK